MNAAPVDFSRRSPIYRELEKLGAEFAEIAGSAAAVTCGGSPEEEAEQARELALCDLSLLRRGGYKGWRTSEWVRGQGVEVGDESNLSTPQPDGSLVSRLSPGELLILGDLFGGGEIIDRLKEAWSMEAGEGAYPVPREDTNCWFLVVGRHSGPMFAKLCGVDLRKETFAQGEVAQTSVARLNAIVIRADIGGVHAFHLLTDWASAKYMWDCLIDAAREFGGKPIGLSAVQRLGKA